MPMFIVPRTLSIARTVELNRWQLAEERAGRRRSSHDWPGWTAAERAWWIEVQRQAEFPSTEGLSTPEDIARWRGQGVSVAGRADRAVYATLLEQWEERRAQRLEEAVNIMVGLCRANGITVDTTAFEPDEDDGSGL
jgi:hypothetical protein